MSVAAEFYNFIGLTFSNIWVQAVLHICFYIGLYILGRISIKFIKTKALERIQKTSNAQIKTEIFQIFYRLAKRVLQLATAYYILTSLPLLDKFDKFVYNFVYVIGIFIGALTLAKIADFVIYYFLHGNTKHLFPLISRIVKIVIGTIALMVGLRHFNQDIWHLATALGIGSLAIGLAAQPTLTNLIAGFNILIDRPFRVGDRIRLATGDVGDVIDIGLRSTHIRTTDGNMLIAPNSELGNSRVLNYSMPDNGTSSGIKLQFGLDSDVTKIKLVLGDALRSIDGVAQPIEVMLSGIVDGNIEINLGIKTDYASQGKVVDKVLQESIFALRRHGIPLADSKFKSRGH